MGTRTAALGLISLLPALGSPGTASPPSPGCHRSGLGAQGQPRAGITRLRQPQAALPEALGHSAGTQTSPLSKQRFRLVCSSLSRCVRWERKGCNLGLGTAAPLYAMWVARQGTPGTARSSSSLCCSVSSPPQSPRARPEGTKSRTGEAQSVRGRGKQR